MWNSLVSLVRTRLPIKHTTNNITITIANVIIISAIFHLPSVLNYKKGNMKLEEFQDVLNTLEYHFVLSGTVYRFCRFRA